MSIAGEPKSIKNLRFGDLLIQCTKQPHEANLLKIKTPCGLKCTVTPHKSLNTSKGIVSRWKMRVLAHLIPIVSPQIVPKVGT